MGKRRTDFRGLRARRDAALMRPELKSEHSRPSDADKRLVEAAIAAGRVTRCPPAGGRR
jgi:hypothetical protein